MHWTRYATLGGLALVSVIGAIDSALTDDWDHVFLFVLVVLLVLPLATSLDRNRRLILLRNDLDDWVRLRSSTTGEPPGAIVDRAVSNHRDRLDPPGGQTARSVEDG